MRYSIVVIGLLMSVYAGSSAMVFALQNADYAAQLSESDDPSVVGQDANQAALQSDPKRVQQDTQLVRDFASEVRQTSLIILDSETLAASKKAYQNDLAFKKEVEAIIKTGDKASKISPYTVTKKTVLPASNNKNDYFTVGPYWWPDPKKKNGLPWIRRDGDVNQAVRGENSDHRQIYGLINTIDSLALAYYFSDNPKYAKRAEKLLRVFFIDEDTKMNPHANYAQAIPGKYLGRGIGIIEFRQMVRMLDGMTLMQSEFQDDTKVLVDEWLTIFMGWLIESDHGRTEMKKENNHGTYYDVILASLSSYLGMDDVSNLVIRNTKARIKSQIERDGRQPHELERTRPFHYSTFNLIAFTNMVKIANNMGVDLLHYPNEDDARIVKAYTFLTSDFTNRKYWSGKQEKTLSLDKLVGFSMIIDQLAKQPRKPNNTDARLQQSISTTLSTILNIDEDEVSRQMQACAPLFNYSELNDISYSSTVKPCTY